MLIIITVGITLYCIKKLILNLNKSAGSGDPQVLNQCTGQNNSVAKGYFQL